MPRNKWTVMFFFASDNTLSPVIVSQLKAIKEAGFQENTEVLVYFDPSERGVPSHIYNVNRERKKRRLERSKDNAALSRNIIGDGEDPFVHNLTEDDIKRDDTIVRSRPAARRVFEALEHPDEISAREALKLFLDFCRENNQADHYILVLVGHGVVVANDAFLSDENPVSSITLKELGETLGDFSRAVKDDGNTFELLAMHSCSMSAIEVAYELKGTAKLMIASEAISYVNSWPHRQLLKKLFKTVERAEEEGVSPDIPELMEKLFFLSFFNAVDFSISGYPLDLALCNLEAEENFTALSRELPKLVQRLKDSVKDGGRGRELIQLAHLEAQSYWGESYTDLFDFCRCLSRRCDESLSSGYGQTAGLEELSAACAAVMECLEPRGSAEPELAATYQAALKKRQQQPKAAVETLEELAAKKLERESRFKKLVIRADSFGSAYQYSHGLSVYFPWAEPVENVGNGRGDRLSKRKAQGVKKALESSTDEKVRELLEGFLNRSKGILERYGEYAFTTELKTEEEDNSWLSFLKTYFDATRREKTRFMEDHPGAAEAGRNGDNPAQRLEGGDVTIDIPDSVATVGAVANASLTSVALDPPKDSPSSGLACICTTVKNYPTVRRTLPVPRDMADVAEWRASKKMSRECSESGCYIITGGPQKTAAPPSEAPYD